MSKSCSFLRVFAHRHRMAALRIYECPVGGMSNASRMADRFWSRSRPPGRGSRWIGPEKRPRLVRIHIDMSAQQWGPGEISARTEAMPDLDYWMGAARRSK